MNGMHADKSNESFFVIRSYPYLSHLFVVNCRFQIQRIEDFSSSRRSRRKRRIKLNLKKRFQIGLYPQFPIFLRTIFWFAFLCVFASPCEKPV